MFSFLCFTVSCEYFFKILIFVKYNGYHSVLCLFIKYNNNNYCLNRFNLKTSYFFFNGRGSEQACRKTIDLLAVNGIARIHHVEVDLCLPRGRQILCLPPRGGRSILCICRSPVNTQINKISCKYVVFVNGFFFKFSFLIWHNLEHKQLK